MHRDVTFSDFDIDENITEEFIIADQFLQLCREDEDDAELDGRKFPDREYVLLPKYVCAFVLQTRKFALLGLKDLKQVAPRMDGWDDLKLPKSHKRTILAQSLSHFRDKGVKGRARKGGYDLVHGKGQGLIMLLHGFPGVGKTSTAECIAAKLNKPLYPITCGDLGSNADTVDQRLGQIFYKAQKWDCVLLLDEADVFLAERTRDDFNRNALVSVFLRTLEYYDGLLFLTTNRVGILDEAFKSRIHTSLYYHPPEKEQTHAIWEVNLKRVQKYKKDGIRLSRDEIMLFASELWDWLAEQRRTQWNGRQIRNAFQTAIALAEYDTSTPAGTAEVSGPQLPAILNRRHFADVAMTIITFDEYPGKAHQNQSESDRAQRKGQRADTYQPMGVHLSGGADQLRWGTPASGNQAPPYGAYGGPSTPTPDPSALYRQPRHDHGVFRSAQDSPASGGLYSSTYNNSSQSFQPQRPSDPTFPSTRPSGVPNPF